MNCQNDENLLFNTRVFPLTFIFIMNITFNSILLKMLPADHNLNIT